MEILGSIYPFVIAGLGFLVIALLIALSVLLFMMIRMERPEWESGDVAAAREVLASVPWPSPAEAREAVLHASDPEMRKHVLERKGFDKRLPKYSNEKGATPPSV